MTDNNRANGEAITYLELLIIVMEQHRNLADILKKYSSLIKSDPACTPDSVVPPEMLATYKDITEKADLHFRGIGFNKNSAGKAMADFIIQSLTEISKENQELRRNK